MPTIFTDHLTITLTARVEQNSLRIDCEAQTLPPDDHAIECLVSPSACVAFSLGFADDDRDRSIEVEHYDSAGQLVRWSGVNPSSHEFGLTGGFIDAIVACTASGTTRRTLIPIKIRPKTDKTF